MRSFQVIAAVLVGVIIGVLLSHPHNVKASNSLYVGRVMAGSNATPMLGGRQVVGFSCVPSGRGEADCYVAAQ